LDGRIVTIAVFVGAIVAMIVAGVLCLAASLEPQADLGVEEPDVLPLR
jgi:hypothetical protein